MQSKEMFTGLTVIELASVLAGPGVGQFFAELGANVIKVENLKTGGDITRTWRVPGEKKDDRSAYFCAVNWGKQSIAIDLTSREGQEIVHQLTAKADIVIASYKPGDAEKLHVDYETLSKFNSKIIYGQITGYGSGNPRVGYDAVIQAESGFMFMNGEPGGKSLKMPVALMDVLAGHQLKEGLLIALLKREKFGEGAFIEVSLIQSAVASLTNQASNFLVAGHLPGKQGSSHPNIAPYGDVFKTRDGKEILLAVGSDRQFSDLCVVLSVSELSYNPEFETNEKRVVNRSTLKEILQVYIEKIDSSDLLDRLHNVNVPAGRIQSLDKVMEMSEAKSLLMDSSEIKGIRTFVVKGLDYPSHITPPPHFGEHRNQVLKQELGYANDKISELIQSKIIG